MNNFNGKILIPTTELRHFYNFIKLFNTNTILEISKELNNNKDRLIKIVKKSQKHFLIYNNVRQNFFPKETRKALPKFNPEGLFENTNQVVKKLKNDNGKSGIEYVAREVDPRRTKNAIFDNGRLGTSSGTGGIDFIGWHKNMPLIGEIKTKSDTTAFQALIQVLTYFTELSTPNQIKRCNNHNLFKNRKLKENQKFILGIVFADFNYNSISRKKILEQTLELAKYIKPHINQIASIKFIEMIKTMDPNIYKTLHEF